MDLIDRTKCRKDLLYAYDDVSMELDVLDSQPSISAIPIPEGATNGDIIKILFPDCEQKEPMYNGYFEKYFNDDLENASYMRVSKDFWDAKYKNEVQE